MKMFKSLILICAIGVTSFIFTDIGSASTFFGLVLPLVFFLSLIAIALWFVMLFHKKGVTQTTHSGGGGTGGFDGGGGDC